VKIGTPMQQVTATVADRRSFGPLTYLTLHVPEIARGVRPGQYLLVRCTTPGNADPFLGRALFVAASDPQAGFVRLLFVADEPGLLWLSTQGQGNEVSLVGPLGKPFQLEKSTRHLLLIGAGATLPALLMLAQEAAQREVAVVLHAGATEPSLLPPPFLLPATVEYQSFDTTGEERSYMQSLPWADQVAAALALEDIGPLVEAVRRAKIRWERGYGQVALSGPLPCVSGTCLGCLIDTREGMRLRCKDGPVFDLRDLR
jgi:dihydroorotate dehydrogenase electron transfer subunit